MATLAAEIVSLPAISSGSTRRAVRLVRAQREHLGARGHLDLRPPIDGVLALHADDLVRERHLRAVRERARDRAVEHDDGGRGIAPAARLERLDDGAPVEAVGVERERDAEHSAPRAAPRRRRGAS
jgi:hypothetical protein